MRNSFGFSTAYIGSVADGTTPPTGAEAFDELSATVEPYTEEGTIPGGATPPNRGRLLGVEILMKDAGDITDTAVTIHIAKGSHGEYELYSGSLDVSTFHVATDGFYYASARATFDPPIPYANSETAVETSPSTGSGDKDTNRLYCYVYGSSAGGYSANVQLFWESEDHFHV